MQRRRRAFTLIELMITASVIIILGSIGVIEFSNVRKHGRDSRRISDIQTVMRAFALAENEGTTLVNCIGNAGPYALRNCALTPQPTNPFDFSRLKDPSPQATSLCTSASTAVCDYSIQGPSAGVSPTPSAYRIRFFIETSSESVSRGLRTARPDGID